MLKKLLVSFMFVAAITTASVSAATVEFTIGEKNFNVEKNTVVLQNQLEAAPFVSNDRTMVPIRAISESFDAEVAWNGEDQKVTVFDADKKIVLTINSKTALVNDSEVALDNAPVVVNDRTFVPLRFISETLGYNVNYVNTTKQVVIDNTPTIIKCGDVKISFAEYSALYELYIKNINQEVPIDEITDEMKEQLAQTTFTNLQNIAKMSNTFAYLPFTDDDATQINDWIKSDNELFTMSMPGLSALVHEKYYLWNDITVYNKLVASENAQDIYEKEYARAKHVLVDDERNANTVYKKALAGTDFDKLIEEFGKDPGAAYYPDGYVFTKGEMVEEFESATFALEIDKISSPVKSEFGYHIIKRLPLPEISAEIEKNIYLGIGAQKLTESPTPEILIPLEELTKKEIYEL